MNNMDIYNRFKEVPDSAKKTIEAGKLKGFTDINPMWRIKMLTDAFGPCGFGWYTEITDKWLESGADGRTAAFVQINLFVKIDNEWSKPIIGVGGAMFVNVFKGQQESTDEAYKMAYTDAISIACKALGMAADVYYDKDRTKYNAFENVADNQDTKKEKVSEYITEKQIAQLTDLYKDNQEQLKKFLKKHNVDNIVQLKRLDAQAQIDRIEAAEKMKEAKANGQAGNA